MRAFIYLLCAAGLLYAVAADPLPAACAAAGAALLVCARFERTTGPLVRAAERAAKSFAMGLESCIPDLQEMARLAFLRRPL